MTLENLKKLTNKELSERFPFMVVYDFVGKPVLGENGDALNHFKDWGWRDVQLALAEHLKPIYDRMSDEEKDNFKILQVKEKYGTLRTYFAYEPKNVLEWVNLAEYISSYTCIKCGKTNHVNNKKGYQYFESQGWICPFCSNCLDKDKEYEPKIAKPYLEIEGSSFGGPNKTSRYDIEQFWKLED